MRLAALDTKFILAYAGGGVDVDETLDFLRRNNFQLIITKSVTEQLRDLIRCSGDRDTRDWAFYAYWMLPQWGVCEPFNPYVENGTSCACAARIREQNLIPGASRIETELLVEASCHRCDLLITFSAALLAAPSVLVNLALVDADMDAVTVAIASPKMIVERMQGGSGAVN